MINDILKNQDEFIRWRKTLHQNPGLGFEEFYSADFVEKKLKEFGFDEVHTKIGITGIVGVLKGNKASDHAIGLRADLDALPIQEENNFTHRSKIDGKMHACGHDGHTATLLACAWYMAKNRDFSGTVYFIFQPAEEGIGGGQKMLEEGLFKRFPCDRIYAYHNMPKFKEGQAFTRYGAFLAGSLFFDVTIDGRGGHAALPHLTIDPTIIMSEIVTSAQTLVSRNTPPQEVGIISFTDIYAGSNSYNVIPSQATMKGCIRYVSFEVRDMLCKRFEACCTDIANFHGAKASICFDEVFVPLINDQKATDIAQRAATKAIGADCVKTDAEIVTGSEDFSFMLLEVPGNYIMFGTGDRPSVHNPKFDFDDNILAKAASYFCYLIEEELGSLNNN